MRKVKETVARVQRQPGTGQRKKTKKSKEKCEKIEQEMQGRFSQKLKDLPVLKRFKCKQVVITLPVTQSDG